MFITGFSTRTESSDHYVYILVTAEKPTYEQLQWYIKENGCEEYDDNLCCEFINEYETIELDLENIEMDELHTSDPRPNVDFL